MLSLAPVGREPNLLDRALPTLTDQAQIFDVRLTIALVMLGLFLVALAWRSLGGFAAKLDARTRARANLALTTALVVAALASSINYFYAERNNGVWLHRWDAFHTVMGGKYFDELGYFDLYLCANAIDQQGPRRLRGVDEIRDLRTQKIVPAQQLLAGNDCAERFTPARLEQFRHDLDQFTEFSNPGMWKDLFKDKGFNGTPFHAWVLTQLLRGNALDYWSLVALALIDVVLLVAAFGLVARVWDVETAAIAGLFFAANFPNHFGYMGGSLLRFDYIAMLIFALAAMKRERWALAGVCVAWATMVRAFPGVFALGLALKAGADLIATRKLPREYLRFFVAYAAAMLIMFGLSLTLAHGFDHWLEWIANIRAHTEHTRGFRVGFKHMFMLDGSLADDANFVGWVGKTAHYRPRTPWFWLAVVLLLAPLLIAARRLDAVSFAALFACGGFLLLMSATRYYYAMMVLPILIDRPLLRDRKHLLMCALLFATAAILHALAEVNPHVPFLYNTACSALFTAWFVIVGALLWLDPELRDRSA